MAGIATVMLITMSLASLVSALNVHYYEYTCPHVEFIVASAVHKATMNDKTVPAALLRMHFHDCFIRVCNFVCPNNSFNQYSYWTSNMPLRVSSIY